jgi:hypothetical protein
MSQGTILIIGGGGKTGARVNARLRAARHRYTTGLALHRNAFRLGTARRLGSGV